MLNNMTPPKPSSKIVTVSRRRTVLSIVLLGFICLGTYFNSLPHGFLMDDFCMFRMHAQWPLARFLQVSPHTFKTALYFRPLTHAVNYLAARLFAANPLPYTLVNLSLFWAAGAVLYFVLLELFRRWELAFLTAAFFGVHPINGVLVNYKSTTGFSLMTVLALLSLWLMAGSRSGDSRWRFGLSHLFFGAALLCHEVMVMFPVYLTAALLLTRPQRGRDILKQTAGFWALAIVYAVFRAGIMGLAGVVTQTAQGFGLTGLSFLAALGRLFTGYLARLVHLQDIVLIWDTPLSGSWDWFWAGSIGIIYCGGAWLVWRWRQRPPLALGLIWLLAGFIPVGLAGLTRSDFGFYLEPHWLIFSSAGFFIILADVVVGLRRWFPPRIWLAFVGCLLFFQILQSNHYNFLWGNQKRYCRYWRTVAPRNYWVNFWLGMSYLKDREYGPARECFDTIYDQGIRHWDTLGNLAVAEFHLGHLDRAQELFLEVRAAGPREAKTYWYLGEICRRRGKPEEARIFFERAGQREGETP